MALGEGTVKLGGAEVNRIGAISSIVVMLVGIAPGVSSGTSFQDWEATASLHVSATSGPPDFSIDSCDTSGSFAFAGPDPFFEELLCEVTAGYGYAQAGVALNTTMSAGSVSIYDAAQAMGYGGAEGGDGAFETDFQQILRIDVTDPTNIHLVGSVTSVDDGSIRLRLLDAVGPLVEYTPAAPNTPLVFDDWIALLPGPHRLEITSHLQHAWGEETGRYPSAATNVDATFGSVVTVAPESWGRVKALYR